MMTKLLLVVLICLCAQSSAKWTSQFIRNSTSSSPTRECPFEGRWTMPQAQKMTQIYGTFEKTAFKQNVTYDIKATYENQVCTYTGRVEWTATGEGSSSARLLGSSISGDIEAALLELGTAVMDDGEVEQFTNNVHIVKMRGPSGGQMSALNNGWGIGDDGPYRETATGLFERSAD